MACVLVHRPQKERRGEAILDLRCILNPPNGFWMKKGRSRFTQRGTRRKKVIKMEADVRGTMPTSQGLLAVIKS